MTREEQEQMILENVPKVYEAGRGSIKNEVANALKGSASGEVVALKDVSPLEHGLGVRVSSKNLANIYGFSTNSINNVNDTRVLSNERGTTISTTDSANSVEVIQTKSPDASNTTSFENGYFCIGIHNNFQDGDIVTISFDVEIKNNPLNATEIAVLTNGVSAEILELKNGRCSVTYTWKNYKDRKYIEVRNSGCSAIFSNFQLELGTTATAYTPFVPDVGAVKVKAMGKNLADIYAFSAHGMIPLSLTNPYGTTISTTEPSDSIEIIQSQTGHTNVTSFMNGYFCIGFRNHFKDGDKITLSFDLEIKENPLNAKVWKFFMNGTSGRQDVSITSGRVSVVIEWSDKDDGKPYVEIRNSGCSCVISNIQLEVGNATEYEPYIEPVEYAVNADGTVEGVKSIYPATTLTTDTVGALIEVDYNRDINKAFEELRKVILSLGGIL